MELSLYRELRNKDYAESILYCLLDSFGICLSTTAFASMRRFAEYVITASLADSETIVFTTAGIENIPNGWRAREIYRIISTDEFVEVSEIAEPGKDLELYSESHYRRKK